MLTDDPGATGVLLNAGPGERGGYGLGDGAAGACLGLLVAVRSAARSMAWACCGYSRVTSRATWTALILFTWIDGAATRSSSGRPANARNRCGRAGIGLTQPQGAALVVNDQPGRAPRVPGQRLGTAAGPGAVATSSANASNCCWISSFWAMAVFSSC